MKLDRNKNEDGLGKYALIKLRDKPIVGVDKNGKTVVKSASIDWGETPETSFFVIRLKDKYAAPALAAYAGAAMRDDPEYGTEVYLLALESAKSTHQRKPD